MSEPPPYERVAIVGAGAIGCGLAACSSALTETLLLARSPESAASAEGNLADLCSKVEGGRADRVEVVTDRQALAGSGLAIEAIAEDADAKAVVLAKLARICPEADLASTTSSLSVADLAERSGRPEGFFAFHVFNPVPRMELVELCFPGPASARTRARAIAWCRSLGKTPVEVPDQAGFVVNRLLFPYLFDAVRLMEATGMATEHVDASMTLGAGHPMGPLSLLDFVGIDVAVAIGRAIHAESAEDRDLPPPRLLAMVEEGRLGRKSGRGFYEYD